MNTDKTTNKYRATFEVPAMVRIEIEIDAYDQQEGLIAAHDLIHQALPANAKVVTLSLDQATNTAFERVQLGYPQPQADVSLAIAPDNRPRTTLTRATDKDASAPSSTAVVSAPNSPLELTGKYRVEFFMSKDQSTEPVKTTMQLAFVDARKVAENLLVDGSLYGSTRVFDEFGTVVLRTMAPRGGFEVHAYQENEPADAAPNTSSDRLFTWLSSITEAKKTALELLARPDIKLVRIVDYTNRQSGPRLVREIR